MTKDYFDVACGEGALRIRELQLEGKKRMEQAEEMNNIIRESDKVTVADCKTKTY